MIWAYGITAIPERENDLLPKTIASLANAGFDNPHLFFDGTPKLSYGRLYATVRAEKILTWGNWWLALWELYIRNWTADRYAIFQDDIVACKNLRKYLEQWYPKQGYLNLYTNNLYKKELTEPNKIKHQHGRWYAPKSQRGQGALGLVFTRDTVRALFASSHAIDRPLTAGKRRYTGIDGGIVSALGRKGEHPEYVHDISLIQHTGHGVSSMGNNNLAPPNNFPGEDFDAMKFLAKPSQIVQNGPKPAGTVKQIQTQNLQSALAIIGLDSKPVEDWLAKQCKCKDRQEKMDRLCNWTTRILSGKTEEAEKYLLEILEPCCA